MADEEKPKRPQPKWMSDQHGNHDRARRSNKHEKRIATSLGGKRIARSGAKRWSPWDKTTDQGDVQTPIFHIEHKRTDNESMSLKKEWLTKVADGALRVAKDPAIVITFEDPVRGKVEDWILVPLAVAKRRMGYNDDEDT